MTPASLILARQGSGTASAAAVTLWAGIVERVAAKYADAALDLVSKHVGSATEVPDGVLRESVVRLAMFMSNTETTLGFSSFGDDDTKVDLRSEYHGAALRRSGVQGLLIPWVVKRAGSI